MTKLTDKQKAFVSEYIIDLNATQAAIRAGYSPDTAQQIGSENLSKPVLQESIQKAMNKRAKRTEVTQDMVVAELAKIAFLDIRDAFDADGNLLAIKEMPEDVAKAIGGLDHTVIGDEDSKSGFTSKIKLIDKKGSLELLGRHLKMFTDKISHEGGVSIILSEKDSKL